MGYVPIKRTADCPHGCGTYTMNKDGKLRKHGRCDQCDGEPCTGVTPLGRQMKILAAGTSAVARAGMREAVKADATSNDEIASEYNLSDAMIRALHFYATPLKLRLSIAPPTRATDRALAARDLLTLDDVKLTRTGLKLARQLEPLPNTPTPILEHWRKAYALFSEPATSPVTVPALDDLLDQITRYGNMCAKYGRNGDTARAHIDIRRVLAILYREAGRS
jgi:hypothetical protein